MSREDQFKGFGRAVIMRLLALRDGGWIDFNEDDEDEIEEYSAVVAQAAYDLAIHVVGHVSERAAALMETEIATPQEIVEGIPDLPEEATE